MNMKGSSMRTLCQRLILGCAIAVVPVMSIAPTFAQTKPAAVEVPVKQVVLFSSGVGYFEHFGNIQGDGSTELRFKTNQINDILKSLILQDLDGRSEERRVGKSVDFRGRRNI